MISEAEHQALSFPKSWGHKGKRDTLCSSPWCRMDSREHLTCVPTECPLCISMPHVAVVTYVKSVGIAQWLCMVVVQGERQGVRRSWFSQVANLCQGLGISTKTPTFTEASSWAESQGGEGGGAHDPWRCQRT